IGRSNRPDAFGKSAGAKLTVTRPAGNSKPLLRIADLTRSRLSRTPAPGSPTRLNTGKPEPTCTSTLTGTASRPHKARLETTASDILPSVNARYLIQQSDTG